MNYCYVRLFMIVILSVFDSLQAQTLNHYHYEDDEDNELVDVSIIASDDLPYDVDFTVDLTYYNELASFGSSFYTHNKLFLHKNTARKFLSVVRECNKQGYRLIVTDGYRPAYLQKKMAELFSIGEKSSLCNDVHGQSHTRGAAIDAYLIDKNGVRIDWEVLAFVMLKHGFTPFFDDKTHFNDCDSDLYKVLNVSFDELVRRADGVVY